LAKADPEDRTASARVLGTSPMRSSMTQLRKPQA
jgi:hypothetical protein